MSRVALISGTTGQDGSYLAEFLLDKGYTVHGIKRRSSSFNTERIDGVDVHPRSGDARLFLHYSDLSDPASLTSLIRDIRPDEIYNLGAQSHVRVSFDIPGYTADVTGLGALRMLEAARTADIGCRFYQASSSEMFGSTPPPQREETPFHPRSPYACAKVYAFWSARQLPRVVGHVLRQRHPVQPREPPAGRELRDPQDHSRGGQDRGRHPGQALPGQPRRGPGLGLRPGVRRGDVAVLQQDTPQDYVVATGEGHSVREFVQAAFDRVGLDWQRYVEIDPAYFRPAEVDALIGDFSKARRHLGWAPKTLFGDLVRVMVDADRQLLEDERMGRLVRVDR